MCDKYAAFIGVKFHPHLLQHTMDHLYLESNPGDIVSLAQIFGHSNLNTPKQNMQRSEGELREAVESPHF